MCGSVRRRPAGQCGGRRWDALPGVPLLERRSNGGTPLAAGLHHAPARRSSVGLFLIFQYAGCFSLLTKLWAAGRSMGAALTDAALPTIPAGASAEQKNNQAGLESRRVH